MIKDIVTYIVIAAVGLGFGSIIGNLYYIRDVVDSILEKCL